MAKKLQNPMSKQQTQQLFDFLREQNVTSHCDGTLKTTIAFLKQNNLPVRESVDWLQSQGGFCDCEVLYNCT